jgi:hypothetical protein
MEVEENEIFEFEDDNGKESPSSSISLMGDLGG